MWNQGRLTYRWLYLMLSLPWFCQISEIALSVTFGKGKNWHFEAAFSYHSSRWWLQISNAFSCQATISKACWLHQLALPRGFQKYVSFAHLICCRIWWKVAHVDAQDWRHYWRLWRFAWENAWNRQNSQKQPTDVRHQTWLSAWNSEPIGAQNTRDHEAQFANHKGNSLYQNCKNVDWARSPWMQACFDSLCELEGSRRGLEQGKTIARIQHLCDWRFVQENQGTSQWTDQIHERGTAIFEF